MSRDRTAPDDGTLDVLIIGVGLSGLAPRAKDILPSQGSRAPWQVYQNYFKDLSAIRFRRIDDGVMRFGTKGAMP
ncbi:MAG: FAD-containing monooxygenase EthA [Herminiimonas sp.]|nr:FAD-containing monooxygenase EthA [Herminiimonas sp.]